MRDLKSGNIERIFVVMSGYTGPVDHRNPLLILRCAFVLRQEMEKKIKVKKSCYSSLILVGSISLFKICIE